MSRITLKGFGLALLALSLTVLGCAEKEKRIIQQLQLDYNNAQARNGELEARNGELQRLLANAEADKEQLKLAQAEVIGEKDAEIAMRTAKIVELEQQLRNKPQPAPTPTGWDPTALGVKKSVGSDVLFSSGRASLSAGGKSALAKMVPDLKGAYAGLPIRVYGHSDSDPIRRSKWKDNLELSTQRAMAVTRYLISRGVKPGRIETIGMGATQPIADNAAAAGKKRNRRVDIVVVLKS